MEIALALAGWTSLFISFASMVVGAALAMAKRTRQVGAALILWWVIGVCASYGVIAGDGALAIAAGALWCAAAITVLVAVRLSPPRNPRMPEDETVDG